MTARHLQSLDRGERTGREGPVRHAEAREHARGAQHGEGDGAGRIAVRCRRDVDELVLADAVVHDGQAAGGDEAPRPARSATRIRRPALRP